MKTSLTDQIGRKISLDQLPDRIVCLNPSQTETLVALGLETSLVGVTKFCVHPSHLRKTKKVVGGTKKVSYEKIRALKPDIILCNKEENTQEMVRELEREYCVHVADVRSFSDALEMIHQYGVLFRCEDKATSLIAQIQALYQDFEGFIKNKTVKNVAYMIWKDPWMGVGTDTFIHKMLELNGFTNIFANQNRYPTFRLEDLQAMEVDTILLSSEPYPFSQTHKNELQQLLPETEILLVDGEYFSWYGSRLLGAFPYFKSLHS